MKSLIARYRLSATLDSSTPRPAPRWAEAAAPDLRDLHRRLRHGPGDSAAPDDLHDSIMRALRTRSDTRDALPNFRWRMWAPAAGVAAAMGLLALAILSDRSGPVDRAHRSLLSAGSAFAAGEMRTPPVVGPLAGELRDVERDLASTARHLRASLP